MKRNMITPFIIMYLIITLLSQCVSNPYGNNSKSGNYATVNGIRLYYEIYGKGKPLIFLHGNGGSINAFNNQIPYFRKHYQVIGIDSRLQGKSGGSPDTISYELMASDVNALLNHLHLDSVYVVGWSDGGIIGLIMAMKYPGKVRKLAISGANIVPDSTALSVDDIRNMKEFVDHNKTASKTQIALNKMMLTQPNIPYPDLKQIKCPVLVMAGDHDMIKTEHTLKIYEYLPNASLCIFPNAYHGVCQQHPLLFNHTVFSFFKK